MKINFPLPTDNEYHQYCSRCHSEDISKIIEQEKTFYSCADCNKKFPHLIVIDPKIVWWIDEITKEYWHESVGVFVFNSDNKALFFERIKYPFAYTIPAGHLDVGENAKMAALREMREETGIHLENMSHLVDKDIIGDECRRGADNHHWH